MNENQILVTCLFGGVGLAVVWWIAVLLSWCASWVCCWMDDFEIGKPKAALPHLVMIIMGYKDNNDAWGSRRYKKNDKLRDSEYAFWLVTFLCLPLPALVIFWQGGIAVLTALALAFAVRMIKRHKKIFDKHVKDKKAHK